MMIHKRGKSNHQHTFLGTLWLHTLWEKVTLSSEKKTFLLLCLSLFLGTNCTRGEVLRRRPCCGIAHPHLSLAPGDWACDERRALSCWKKKTPFWLLCLSFFPGAHCTHAEALRRRPCRGIACPHFLLAPSDWWACTERRVLSRWKKKTPFWLLCLYLFLGAHCVCAEVLRRHSCCGIALFCCVLAPHSLLDVL